MRRPTSVILGLGALGTLALSACQSTQDKAAEIQAQGQAAVAAQVPLTIPKPNKDVKVLSATVLNDEFGSAVAVELENTTGKTLVGVPILIDVRDAKGKPVFRNDAFGSEFALNHVPLIKPGEASFWVNDQILANGDPKTVRVTVGQPDSTSEAELPELAISSPRLNRDPSGIEVEGSVTNSSQLDQLKLILFAVARRGGRVVAAGRGQLKKLRAGARPGRYNIFFIGDPRGAEITVTAPPPVLE